MGIRKILAKVGSYFAKKPPKKKPLPAPTVGSAFRYGHRGVAAGNVAQPDVSPENRAKWRVLGEETARGFMEGEPLFVHSTNVAMAQYFPDANKLMVEFKGGGAYMYDDISPDDAWNFLHAASKGAFVWDVLRIRGTVHGHKKPFRKVK